MTQALRVHEACRGLGVGKRLAAAAMAHITTALAATARRIRVTVMAGNATSTAMHLQQGYALVQRVGLLAVARGGAAAMAAMAAMAGQWPPRGARPVSAAALWALYARLPAAAREALVPRGLVFHTWEVADMAADSLLELEARGHVFLACTASGGGSGDAEGAGDGELLAFAVLNRSKRVRGDSLYAALFAAPEPATEFVPLLLHLFATAAGPTFCCPSE